MGSIKHLLSLLIFEIVAILPVVLIIHWAQKYGGGFKWATNSESKFNYHPVFMTIGFVFVMGHALITFRILPTSHKNKKYIHATLNIVGGIFAIIGFAAILQYHNEQGFANFNSLHSWLGLIALAILLLQALFGLGIFQDLVRGASGELRALYKPWHVIFGTIMVTLVSVVICTGLQEQYGFSVKQDLSPQAYTLNFLAVSILLWAMTVIYILVAVKKNAPQVEDRAPLLQGQHDDYQALPETPSQKKESVY